MNNFFKILKNKLLNIDCEKNSLLEKRGIVKNLKDFQVADIHTSATLANRNNIKTDIEYCTTFEIDDLVFRYKSKKILTISNQDEVVILYSNTNKKSGFDVSVYKNLSNKTNNISDYHNKMILAIFLFFSMVLGLIVYCITLENIAMNIVGIILGLATGYLAFLLSKCFPIFEKKLNNLKDLE